MEFFDTIEKYQGRTHKKNKRNVFKKISMGRAKNNLVPGKQDGADYQSQKIRDNAPIFALGLENIDWRVLDDINIHFFLNPRLGITRLMYDNRGSDSMQMNPFNGSIKSKCMLHLFLPGICAGLEHFKQIIKKSGHGAEMSRRT